MGVYWIRLKLDSYTASRRCTRLRKKVQSAYMAQKTVLELLVSRTVSLQSDSASRPKGLPWQLNTCHLLLLDADKGDKGSSICKNRKGLLVNKL
jgi:hypothetical protein